MAQVNLEKRVTITRRWFFWPALVCVSVLGRVGLIKDNQRAAKWLCDHAMRIEVR